MANPWYAHHAFHAPAAAGQQLRLVKPVIPSTNNNDTRVATRRFSREMKRCLPSPQRVAQTRLASWDVQRFHGYVRVGMYRLSVTTLVSYIRRFYGLGGNRHPSIRHCTRYADIENANIETLKQRRNKIVPASK